MRVRVYRNLRHGWKARPLYSIVDLKTGRVIDRRHHVMLANVTFRVSEAGRQRVIKDQRKNVHAFVIGELLDSAMSLNVGQRVSYNPYTMTSFQVNGEPVSMALFVELSDTGMYAKEATS